MVLVSGGPSSALCVALAARRSPPPLLMHVRGAQAGADRTEGLTRLAAWADAELLVVPGPRSDGPDGRGLETDLLAQAAALARAHGISRVYTGARRGEPGPASGLEVRRPCSGWPVRRVVAEAIRLGVPLQWTTSCTEPTTAPCGTCRGCRERSAAFAGYGAIDPAAVTERRPPHVNHGRPPSLVYLMGMPYSGSTLLGLLLGDHPEIFAAGEVGEFGDDLHAGAWCACGVRLDVCAFWEPVVDAVGDLTALRSPGPAFKELPDARSVVQLLQEAGRQAGASVVLDSSKSPAWCTRLLEADPDWRVLHLIRDGRAAIHSRRKREGMDGSAAVVARRWRDTNEACDAIVDELGDRALRVRYEDLVTTTQAELDRICTWLELDPIGAVPDHQRAESHQVRGNLMRFDRQPIALDDAWRHALRPVDLEEFDRIAGPLAARHGYGRVG